jgi:hypothetical protein
LLAERPIGDDYLLSCSLLSSPNTIQPNCAVIREITNLATATNETIPSDLINGLTFFQSMIDFFTNPTRHFLHDAAEGKNIALLNQPKAVSHSLNLLFWIVVKRRVYQLVALKMSANCANFCGLTGIAVSTISVSVINRFHVGD